MGTGGSQYCVLSLSDKKGLGPCKMQHISDAFDCPQGLLNLKHDNWAQTLWERFGLSLSHQIYLLMGATTGVIWTLLMLFVDTIKQFNLFYGGNVKWSQK